MPPDESGIPADWLRIAEKDLLRVDRALRDDDPELAGFCLQQAVEKLLKAYLLSCGWTLRRTHDLKALLDDATVYEAGLEQFRSACLVISAFYTLERYPLARNSELTSVDVRDAFASIAGLIRQIRQLTS